MEFSHHARFSGSGLHSGPLGYEAMILHPFDAQYLFTRRAAASTSAPLVHTGVCCLSDAQTERASNCGASVGASSCSFIMLS
jgi:hypothetical protein